MIRYVTALFLLSGMSFAVAQTAQPPEGGPPPSQRLDKVQNQLQSTNKALEKVVRNQDASGQNQPRPIETEQQAAARVEAAQEALKRAEKQQSQTEQNQAGNSTNSGNQTGKSEFAAAEGGKSGTAGQSGNSQGKNSGWSNTGAWSPPPWWGRMPQHHGNKNNGRAPAQ